MALSHRDILRSVMSYFAGQVAPIPVMYDAAVESTASSAAGTAGIPVWFDGDIISLDALNDQRNADYLMRGTLRIRGFWRQLPGAPAGVAIDDKFKLSQAAETALRGANILVTDLASGTGANTLAAALFGEMSTSTLEPMDGVGIILVNAEFILS